MCCSVVVHTSFFCLPVSIRCVLTCSWPRPSKYIIGLEVFSIAEWLILLLYSDDEGYDEEDKAEEGGNDDDKGDYGVGAGDGGSGGCNDHDY